MNNKSKLIFAFSLGAIIGAAIVALLKSNKGAETADRAKQKINDLGKEFDSSVDKLENDILGVLNNLRKKNSNS